MRDRDPRIVFTPRTEQQLIQPFIEYNSKQEKSNAYAVCPVDGCNAEFKDLQAIKIHYN